MRVLVGRVLVGMDMDPALMSMSMGMDKIMRLEKRGITKNLINGTVSHYLPILAKYYDPVRYLRDNMHIMRRCNYGLSRFVIFVKKVYETS